MQKEGDLTGGEVGGGAGGEEYGVEEESGIGDGEDGALRADFGWGGRWCRRWCRRWGRWGEGACNWGTSVVEWGVGFGDGGGARGG